MLELIRQFGVSVEFTPIGIELPDQPDAVFYEIVLNKDEAFLITGNKKHFPERYFIVTPTEMMKILQESFEQEQD